MKIYDTNERTSFHGKQFNYDCDLQWDIPTDTYRNEIRSNSILQLQWFAFPCYFFHCILSPFFNNQKKFQRCTPKLRRKVIIMVVTPRVCLCVIFFGSIFLSCKFFSSLLRQSFWTLFFCCHSCMEYCFLFHFHCYTFWMRVHIKWNYLIWLMFVSMQPWWAMSTAHIGSYFLLIFFLLSMRLIREILQLKQFHSLNWYCVCQSPDSVPHFFWTLSFSWFFCTPRSHFFFKKL